MLKKRLIFTLLYSDRQFMLSRNFRLQKVGDLKWLQTHYNFSHISHSIDELIVLNVTPGGGGHDEFCRALQLLADDCFIPISAGGGVNTIETARNLLRAGADKIIINTALYSKNGFIRHLASVFGQQCVVASMDIKRSPDGIYQVWSEAGRKLLEDTAPLLISQVVNDDIGELYLNSIDRDGTGQGYDFELLDMLPNNMSKPVILAGGVGNVKHLEAGLADPRVDAAATAHLFNFVGDGLKNARYSLINNGINLPSWDIDLFDQFFKKK